VDVSSENQNVIFS